MTSIVIPTYGRDQVLIDTVQALLDLRYPAKEILVVDQTPEHDEVAHRQLSCWNDANCIRWIRRETPSITAAMNAGLQQANSDLVLFLDDDIRPRSELVRVHSDAHTQCPNLWATVGQVIQPWQQPEDIAAPRELSGLRIDDDFPFHSTREMPVRNVMAGNLCVNRNRAISIGGFDEQFVGSAFRFETEFARRVSIAGGEMRFLGSAGIDHLRVDRGGTRSHGNHLTSADPRHGIGDHYFALLHAPSKSTAHLYCARRIAREVRTRFHMTHPWWVPVKVIGECRAFFAAKRLIRQRQT
ncbi:glycosyltransferase family 2 protein [Rhodopirellula sp. MGV]|uniref:glycosyltransferase family 2 protein n=1 Tax=Rhodopirellula sp. MGV TaxID=2023130 RepID=UPI000B97107F|nr:glycosyltransferase family A protein [Rhodopirellula sp. MGV]OYP39153.1 hypothetical protein CGZ80_00455 [Rhodopirellula sp. MGV]PNY35470.1 glycosyltransferase family 2 protein [Rhodopirellula baltica]